MAIRRFTAACVASPSSAGLAALLFVLAISSIGSTASPPRLAFPDSSTTVFVVRHAEKMPPTVAADPPLSAAGFKRAQALAHALGAAEVSAIYTSERLRARQTALPLATKLGDSLRVVNGSDIPALARRIREECVGRTVLVIGHSDTVPLIVQELSGLYVPPMKDDEFDLLYVVTLFRDRPARVIRLRYGDAGRAAP